MLFTLHYPLFTGGEAAPAQSAATIETIAGTGDDGYRAADDGGAATAARLNEPWGVALDGAGNLYIADKDNHRIRKVDAVTGIISTVAGTGMAGGSGDGGAATAAQLNQPLYVAADEAGNLYIADTNNHRVRKVDAATEIISTVAGSGMQGYNGDGAALLTRLDSPYGVALDSAGDLYIADSGNNRIRKVIAVGQGTVVSTVAGTGNGGYRATDDGAAAASAQLNFPIGVALDRAGNLYIGDTFNHRIRKVDTAGVITTIAGDGMGSFSGDGGRAAAAQVNTPYGVAADGSGNIYIADRGNQRIRKIDAVGIMTTVAGTGTGDFSGDGGAAAEAQLNAPFDVAADRAGNLYIGDAANHRIRKVTFPPPLAPAPEQPPAVLSQSFALSFLPAQGGEPAAQTITLYAESGAADFEAIPGARWIEAAPRSGTLAAGAQTVITVTVNPAGLSEGTYRARLYIRSGGRVTATIRIVLEVPPPTGPAVSQAGGVVNAARMSAYGGRGLFGPQLLPLAPGAAVVVQGVNFAPGEGTAEAQGYPLPTMLGGTRVLIDGAEAPLFAVGPRRIEAQLPWALGGEAVQAGGLALAEVVVESGGARSWPRRFWAAPSAPGVFTVSGTRQGQAAVLFAGTAALAAPLGASEGSRPARAGDVLEIYATGLGAVEPPIADGRNSCAPDGVCLADGSNVVLRHTVAQPRVWIGAYELAPGNIRFSGLAPILAGMNLVVVEVPPNLAPSEAAELRLAVGGRTSQSGAAIAIE